MDDSILLLLSKTGIFALFRTVSRGGVEKLTSVVLGSNLRKKLYQPEGYAGICLPSEVSDVDKTSLNEDAVHEYLPGSKWSPNM